jgi:hypothetical protein
MNDQKTRRRDHSIVPQFGTELEAIRKELCRLGLPLSSREMSDAQEFILIKRFVAACRQQWPGAKIVLRPNQDGASTGASAPINPEPAPGDPAMISEDFTDDLDTPTEADLDSCYGSKYLSAADLGDQKIRSKIAKVRKVGLQQQGGGPVRNKFVLSFASLDKEMVLNTTNKNALVEVLGRRPADWIGAEVGIYAEPTTFAGKPTKGLRLRVLNKPAARSAPQPAPSLAQRLAAEPSSSEDPGFASAENFEPA